MASAGDDQVNVAIAAALDALSDAISVLAIYTATRHAAGDGR
ncbi:MAG: hypothetical protein ACYDD1_19340 [Caulobacteraceae bacterium]